MILESNFKDYKCYKLVNNKNEVYYIEVLESLTKKDIQELFKIYVEKNYYIYFENTYKIKRLNTMFTKEDIAFLNNSYEYLIRL